MAGCATTATTTQQSTPVAPIQVAPARGEPANLTQAKQDVRAYVDSGRYQTDLASVGKKAEAWLEQRVAQKKGSEKLAIVFDLDETLLMNYPHIVKNDFGYLPEVWNGWVAEGTAPAIEPVRRVYRTARRLGVSVIYITGRPEPQYDATKRNLQMIECADFVALVCKPDAMKSATAATFKAGVRERMTKEGWTIVASVGDQQSDLDGGFAERTFKLPNPFYFIE
ncbi:MAG: HAD family acid phosphatase [Verrucomicrobiota bacterium]